MTDQTGESSGGGLRKRVLLVTGASGFLGWNLCLAAGGNYKVAGLCFSKSPKIPRTVLFKTDLTRFKEVRDRFRDIVPDAVVHTAAISDTGFCQRHPKQSRAVNVGAAVHLAELCAQRSIPFVFTSSDLVFEGTAAPYSEADQVGPVLRYGEQKVEAEEKVLNIYPDAAVCRMPLMFGDGGPAAFSFLHPMLEAMRSGKNLRLFKDEFRTPVSGREAAKGLLLALGKVNGLLHLGGPERISRYQFGIAVRNAFRLETAVITGMSQVEAELPAPRPRDVSLDSTKAENLGFTPPPLPEQIAGEFLAS